MDVAAAADVATTPAAAAVADVAAATVAAVASQYW